MFVSIWVNNPVRLADQHPNDNTLTLPLYSQWSDDDLIKFSTREFIDLLYKRALSAGEDIYDSNKYEIIDLDDNVKIENSIFYLGRRAWAEWYFGVETPARQLVLLQDEFVDIKLKLGQQIVDEVRHYKVFSDEILRRGREWHLDAFRPPPAAKQMYAEILATESPTELAAANQYTGEIILMVASRENNNIFRKVLESALMSAIDDVERDEPSHISVGYDILLRTIDSIEMRRKVADAQERMCRALISQHVSEIQRMGSRRIISSPSFESVNNQTIITK